jgi:hypothetical protein
VLPAGPSTSEYQDSELVVDTLTLGSFADCSIQLLGEGIGPHHAVIRMRGAQCEIECTTGRKIIYNGKPVAHASLAVGEQIEVVGHRLRRFAASGFELALELQPDPNVSAAAYEGAFETDLGATWLSKRRAAWILTAIVVGVGFLLPYISIAPQRGNHSPAAFLPSDQFWNAGPLIAAHQLAAGQRCGNCHEQLFTPVQDSACRTCHRAIHDHVSKVDFAKTHLDPVQRCAQCHQEHHAGAAGIVIRDNSLCVDCHANPHTSFGSLQVAEVKGFSADTHPQFKVSLLKPADSLDSQGHQQWTTSREPVKMARQSSNLTFSHAQHLDPAQVRQTGSRVALVCQDCHVPAADGEHFQPITMKGSCATGSCHQLTFDVSAPDRQLPHARPRDAIAVIQDYFVRQAVDPKPPRTFQRRPLPDQQTAGATCSGPAFACAMERAQIEIQRQFKESGCASCHHVDDTHAPDILDRYKVLPVRLTLDYFPHVHFSHRQHAVQKDKTGDAACLSCHPIRNSTASQDLFIPNLNKCLECHSERLTAQRVTLQCTSCHRYHPQDDSRIARAVEIP